jgi:uncharacterized protein (TIGR02118 family)
MVIVTAVFPNVPGSRFDRAYYLGIHYSLATKMLQPLGMRRVRIMLGEADLAGNAPPFWAVSEMHFESREAFDDAMQRCGASLVEDARNYTNVEPTLLVASVHE